MKRTRPPIISFHQGKARFQRDYVLRVFAQLISLPGKGAIFFSFFFLGSTNHVMILFESHTTNLSIGLGNR